MLLTSAKIWMEKHYLWLGNFVCCVHWWELLLAVRCGSSLLARHLAIHSLLLYLLLSVLFVLTDRLGIWLMHVIGRIHSTINQFRLKSDQSFYLFILFIKFVSEWEGVVQGKHGGSINLHKWIFVCRLHIVLKKKKKLKFVFV